MFYPPFFFFICVKKLNPKSSLMYSFFIYISTIPYMYQKLNKEDKYKKKKPYVKHMSEPKRPIFHVLCWNGHLSPGDMFEADASRIYFGEINRTPSVIYRHFFQIVENKIDAVLKFRSWNSNFEFSIWNSFCEFIPTT